MTSPSDSLVAALADAPHDDDLFESAIETLRSEGDWEQIASIGDRHAGRLESRWVFVADAMEAVAAQEGDPSDRARLLTAIGDVWSRQLKRDDQAVLHYQAAFKVDRSSVVSLERAREIFSRQEKWPMVQRLYQVEARVAESPERTAALLTDAGRVQRDILRDPIGARDYFEQALRAHPDFELAKREISGVAIVDVSGELEALKHELQGAQGSVRAELLYQIAEILLSAEEPEEDPAAYLSEARSLGPASPEGMRIVAQQLRRQERGSELLDVLVSIAQSDASTAERAAAALEAHDLSERLQGDSERADELLRSALGADPAHFEAVERARAWYAQRGEWPRLAEVLDAALRRRASGPGDVAWHRALGDVYAERLDNLEAAETHYRRVRMLDGTDEGMLDFYVRYYRSKSEPRKLLAALHACREIEDDMDAVRGWTAEMAEVAETDLEDPVRAVDVWTWFSKRYPGDRQSTRELKRLLVVAGRWNRLLELLKSELQSLSPGATNELIDTHLQIAKLYRLRVKLPMFEMQALQAVLALSPAHPEAVDAVANRFGESQRWVEAAQTWIAGADASQDDDQSVSWYLNAGQVWRANVGDPGRALKAVKEAARLKPEAQEVLAALEPLYTETGDSAGRLDVLRRRAKLAPLAEREAMLRATLDEPIAQDVRRGVLQDLLDATGGSDADVASELASSHRAAGDPSAAARVLAQYVAGAADAADSQLIRELATLYRRHSNQPAAAAELYGRLVGAGEPLDVLGGDWIDALALGEQWETLETLPGSHPSLAGAVVGRLALEAHSRAEMPDYLRAARAARRWTQDTERAVSMLEVCLDANPEAIEVATLLGECYAEIGDASGMAQMLEMRVHASEGAERVELQLRLAEICADELGAPHAALSWLLAAFDGDSSREDVRDKARALAERESRVAEWAAALRASVAQMAKSDVRRGHYHALADAYIQSLGDPDSSEHFYRRIVDEDPSDERALGALASRYRDTGAWDDLAAILEQQLENAQPDARETLAAELVVLRVARLDRPDDPLAAYQELTGGRPESLSAVVRMREGFEEAAAWGHASNAAKMQAALCDDPEDKFVAECAAASLLAQSTGGVDTVVLNAFAVLLGAAPNPAAAARAASALRDVPADPEMAFPVLDLVEPAYRAAGAWESLGAVLRDRVRATSPEGAPEVFRDWLEVEREQRADAGGEATVWAEWIAGAPLSAADALIAEEACTRLDARDWMLRAWERRLASPLRDEAAWLARDPALTLPREALSRRLRVAVHGDPEQLAVWIDAVREGYTLAGDLDPYYVLVDAVLADDRLGGVARPTLQAELGLRAFEDEERRDEACAALVAACHGGVVTPLVVECLAALAGEADNAEAVADALESTLRSTAGEENAPRIHRVLGAVYRDQLSQSNDAARHYEAAVFLDDSASDALDALEVLYSEMNAHEELAAVILRIAESLPKKKRAARLLEVAELQAAHLGDTELAIQLAQEAKGAGAKGAEERIIHWLRTSERWQDLADVLLERYERGGKRAMEALRERARLLDSPLGHRRAATSAWEAVRKAHPEDGEALAELDRLYGALAETGAQIAVIEARIAQSADEQDIELQRRLVWAQHQQGDAISAVRGATQLLAVSQDDTAAFEVLEQIASSDEGLVASEALFAVFNKAARWADASRVARQRAALSADETALDWLARAEDIERGKLGDVVAAFALALERFRRTQGRVPVGDAMWEFASEADGWSTLSLTLDELREQLLPAPRDVLWLSLRLALEQKAGDADVLGVGMLAHEQYPDDDRVLRIVAQQIPLSDARAVPLRAAWAERAPSSERVEAVALWADSLEAVEAWTDLVQPLNQLLETSPDDPALGRRYEHALRATGDWQTLADWYRAAKQTENVEERERAVVALAQVLRSELESPADALVILRQAATAGVSLNTLEREVDAIHMDLDTPPEIASEALQLQTDILRQAGDKRRLAAGLERAVTQVSPQERLAIRRELAELYEEHLDDPHAAFNAWTTMLREAPDREPARASLRRLAAQLGRWAALADVLRAAAEAAGVAPLRWSLLREVAEIQEGFVDDLRATRTTWERICSESKQDEDERQLERVMWRLEDWDGLSTWYRERAAAMTDDGQSALAFHRAATIDWTMRKDLDAAIDALALGTERTPGARRLIDDLVQLLELAERYEPIIDVLDDAIRWTDGLEDRVALRIRLARVFEERLDDPSRAAEALRVALAEEPSSDMLFDSVARAYRAAEDWVSLVELLEQRLETGEPAQRRSVRRQLMAICGEELGEIEAAVSHGIDLLEETWDEGVFDSCLVWITEGGGRNETVASLGALAVTAGDGDRELEVLRARQVYETGAEASITLAERLGALGRDDEAFEQWLETARQPAGEANAWEALLPTLADPQRLARVASLLEQPATWPSSREVGVRVGIEVGTRLAADPRTAARAEAPLTRALQLDPQRVDAIALLEPILLQSGQVQQFYELLERAAAHGEGEDEDEARTVRRMAALAENELQDNERALDAWHRIAGLEPEHAEPRFEIARLAKSLSLWQVAVDAWMEAAELAETDSERSRRLTEGAVLGIEHATTASSYIPWLEDAVLLDENNELASDTLISVLEQSGSWSDLLDQLSLRAERVTENESASLWMQAAAVAEEKLSDNERAAVLAENAVTASPTESNRRRLRELLHKAGRVEELIAALEIGLAHKQDAVAAQTHLEIASLSMEALGDFDAARANVAEALKRAPGDLRAMLFSARLYLEAGDSEAARKQLEAAADIAAPEEQALVFREQGKAALDAGQSAEGLMWLTRAFALEPTDAELYATLAGALREQEDHDGLRDIMFRRAEALTGAASCAVWKDLGKLAVDVLSDPATARIALEEAHAADPDDQAATHQLLRWYIEDADPQRAEPLIEALIGSGEKSGARSDLHRLYHLRGRIAEQRESAEDAVSAYELSLRAQASFAPSLLALGRIYQEKDDTANALRVLQTALLHQMNVRTPARRVDLFVRLGEVREQTGDILRARDMFERALRIQPESEAAQRGITRLGQSPF